MGFFAGISMDFNKKSWDLWNHSFYMFLLVIHNATLGLGLENGT